MPISGGPANKLGNRYELWWTVSQLIRIIDDKADSICIEELSVDKAEFILNVGNHQELHQAKRSHSEGKWSLASLNRSGLLRAVCIQLSNSPKSRFVFVSSSDAPELRELTERARFAENPKRFQTSFLGDQNTKNDFDTLKKFWAEEDDSKAYGILRRIDVRTTDEQGIQDSVHERLKTRFLTDPGKVSDALRSLAEDSIHQTLDRDHLVTYLNQKAFSHRKLSKPEDAAALVNDITNQFLHATRPRLIQGSLIPRATTRDLIATIKAQSNSPVECILTGKAGGGKTACVIECVEALRHQDERIMVLAFRLATQRVSSTKELGELLGLEESPALVLAAAAETESVEAVLLIDQVDAVSTTSGRNPEFLDVVIDLTNEARRLATKAKIHIVIVCREFDWDNDHRLRKLSARDACKFTVSDFSIDEVRNILDLSGITDEIVSADQIEILRLPQNLKLFLEAPTESHVQPAFSSPKDLFDRYWKEKRNKVNQRSIPQQDYWNGVIQKLCSVMTDSQQLSVSKEHLDDFPDAYLESMVSEGVLSLTAGRYGFGHELFFDYCFARGFVSQDTTLTTFLLESEQHLFRRAQVRQILAYFRDADSERYAQELYSVLTSQRIRPHIKDLILAWVFSLQNPKECEWIVLIPWIEARLDSTKNSGAIPIQMASLVWDRFFSSTSWFQFADQKGLVADWLGSDFSRIADLGTKYVRFHQRLAGDRVAALLEPYVTCGGEWPERLNFIMRWAQLEHSRRLFELFLRLIENGTLDDFGGPISSSGIFWSVLVNQETQHPTWIAEALAQWLRRRLSVVKHTWDDTGNPRWQLLFTYERLDSKFLEKAATEAPEAFTQHVLPAVLEIADHACYKCNNPEPRRDAVWSNIFLDDQSSMAQVCINALSIAVEQLAERNSADGVLDLLRQNTTYIANFILLRAYAADVRNLADEAVTVLCDEPWRFKCGFADSEHWVSRQLVGAAVRHCTEQSRVKLEQAVLAYNPKHDCSRYAYRQLGKSSYELLSSFPSDLRSQPAQRRFLELERKFGKPQAPPQKMQAYRVGSPIDRDSAERMNDEQWLGAMREYDTKERKNVWENPERGGALELARILEEQVKHNPKRFAQLSLDFPSSTHPEYMDHTLRGLKDTKGFADLKLDVCRKAFNDDRKTHGQAIVDLLGAIEGPLPADAIQMLDWLACVHPDPIQELSDALLPGGTSYFEKDILTHGINTTRGRAAWAVAKLLLRDASHFQRLQTIIERLVNDYAVAVRSCTATILLAIFDREPAFAIEQFLSLVEPRGNRTYEDRLLGTRDAKRFIQHGIYHHFDSLQPVIERMLQSDIDETSNTGARLVSMATLLGHERAGCLAEQACIGKPSQRLGVVQVAAANIDQIGHRHWCEEKLLRFFDDCDSRVRQEAASCFRNLGSQSLIAYKDLIGKFCCSAAYDDNSFHLLSALDQTSNKLPGITLIACRKFFERFGTEANDMRTSRSIDGSTAAKLILRTYHQNRENEWAVRCLDLIDQMCLVGFYEIRSILDKYER